MLLPTVENEKRWDEKLNQIQWSINTMTNKTTNRSPFQLLYCYEPRDTLKNSVVQALQCTDDQVLTTEELQQLRTDTATRIDEHRADAKKRYDAKHAKPTVYSEGDLVLAENEPASTGTSPVVPEADCKHMATLPVKYGGNPGEQMATLMCVRAVVVEEQAVAQRPYA
ncbi:uncharacterized protein Dyak_GE28829 [Drosophila yakuba]|uniref:Uncharacterized protein n=1 Tax=Drosophila yakuba TaxID=7245 RepID=A0A0R1E6X8_DROYA|nr:uncharacterized protein Dyak_GE28829 [Drosophila yakuba]